MDIAVVILNWNGKKLLEQFLPSVVQFSNDATIYLADNASTDTSIEFVRAIFPTVKIIKNTVNGGYAKGYNDALKDLIEPLYVLVNNDVEVTENWLDPIRQAFETDHTLVAAQPKILDFKAKDCFEYAGAAGGFIDALGYPYCRGRIFSSIEKDIGQYNDSRPIFWATGACLFLRGSAFKNVGGFDEDFFTHQEEIDLCWRLQSAGGVVKYFGNSTIFHLGGATLKASNPSKTFYNFRNSLLMLVKNRKGPGVWWLLFMRLLLDGIAAVQFLVYGKIRHFLAIPKAHFSFYRLLPKILKKRKLYASSFKYYAIKSIIWHYFILKKRNFRKGF